jgi:enoyl-CoA hydratase/carnithine racemase
MQIHYTKHGHVGVFTLDNPPVNAFTPALHKRFYELLTEFQNDKSVKVGIWTAAGSRAFCAGDDIKTPRPERTHSEIVERYLSPRTEDEALEYPGWELKVMRFEKLKPIIAAINGPTMGAGLMYLMNLTEIRIATPNATFGLPEIKYAMPGACGQVRIGRQLPHVAAMWLALTGEPFNVQQALQYALINEVVDASKLMDRAFEIAELIARHPALSIRTEMEIYYRAMDMTREQAISYSEHLARLQRVAFDTGAPLAKKAQ